MPPPEFIITQTIPTCSYNHGGVPSLTNFDNGQLEVNSNCCRSYGHRVRVNDYSLSYEGELDPCAKSGTGTKTFSGPSRKLCGSNGAAFAGSHSGGGEVVGAAFSGSGVGTLTGARTGLYEVTVEGTFTDPSNGSFTGTLSGGVVGTFSGTIVAGVVTTTYTMSDGTTLTDTGGSYTIEGGGLSFTFLGSFSGFNPDPIMVYDHVTWTGCEINCVTYQVRLVDDDSVIAEYTNPHYALRLHHKTILSRKSIACSHPCIGHLTQKQAFALHPPTMCFSATNGPTCGGNPAHATYTAEVTAGGYSGLTDLIVGTVLGPGPSAQFVDDIGLIPVEMNFSATGTYTDGGGATPGVTVDVSIPVDGYYDSSGNPVGNSYTTSISVNFCLIGGLHNGSPPSGVRAAGLISIFVNAVGSSISVNGGAPVNSILQIQLDAYVYSDVDFNYCDGAVTLSEVAVGHSYLLIQSSVGGINPGGFILESTADAGIAISLTGSGTYPP